MKIVIHFKLEGMPWPKTDVTHYHAHVRAQMGLPDKGRAILGLVCKTYGISKTLFRDTQKLCIPSS